MAKKKKALQGIKKGKSRDNDPTLLEREGQKFFSAGNYAGAITTWNRLLKLRGGSNNTANKKLLPLLAQANFCQAKSVPVAEKLPYLFAASVHSPDTPNITLTFLHHCRETGKVEEFLNFCRQMISERKNEKVFAKIKYLLEVEKGGATEAPKPVSDKEAKHLKLLTLLQQHHVNQALRAMETLPKTDYYSFIAGILRLEKDEGEDAKKIWEKLSAGTDPVVVMFSRYYLAVHFLQNGQPEVAEGHLAQYIEKLADYPAFVKGPRRHRLANMLSKLALVRAERGELDKAADLWKNALQWVPESKAIFHNLERVGCLLATVYAREGQLEKALQFWEPLFKQQNSNPLISKNLAIAQQALGNFPEAIRYWEHTANLWEQNLNKAEDVLRLKHDLIRAYEQLAVCHGKAGQSWYLKKTYQRILELDPQNLQVKSKLAEHYLEDRSLEEAFALLDELVEEEPENALHLTNLGIACEVSHRLEEARKWWEKALEVNPHEGTAIELLSKQYYTTAMSCYRKRRFDESLDILEKLLKLKPKHYQALSLRGAVYSRQGKTEMAESSFQQAVDCDPQNPVIYMEIGSTMLDSEEDERAEYYFSEAERHCRNPFQLPEILMNIGMVYCRHDTVDMPGAGPMGLGDEYYQVCQNGDYCEEGAAYFWKAIAFGSYDIALSISEFLLDIDCNNTIKFAEQAHRMNRVDPYPLFYQAMYHLRHQNFAKCLKVLDRARATPGYETNAEMQSLVARMSQFADVARYMV